jgi:hypothetical protein
MLFHSGKEGEEFLEAPRTTLQLMRFDKLRKRYFSMVFVVDILYILLF